MWELEEENSVGDDTINNKYVKICLESLRKENARII